jgi:two-component sensor histidine kinase
MPPGRKGFGSRLIEGGLAHELDGEVHLNYEPEGVVCQIVMPALAGLGHD